MVINFHTSSHLTSTGRAEPNRAGPDWVDWTLKLITKRCNRECCLFEITNFSRTLSIDIYRAWLRLLADWRTDWLRKRTNERKNKICLVFAPFANQLHLQIDAAVERSYSNFLSFLIDIDFVARKRRYLPSFQVHGSSFRLSMLFNQKAVDSNPAWFALFCLPSESRFGLALLDQTLTQTTSSYASK